MTTIRTSVMLPDGNASRPASGSAPHSSQNSGTDDNGTSTDPTESRPAADGYQYTPSQKTLEQRTDQAYQKYAAARAALSEQSTASPERQAELGIASEEAKKEFDQAVSSEISGKIQDAYGQSTPYSTKELITSFGNAIKTRLGGGETVADSVKEATATLAPGDQEKADQIVKEIAGATVNDRIGSLAAGLQGASPQTQALILKDPSVQSLLEQAANHAADPARVVLGTSDLTAESAPRLLKAADHLVAMTKDLPPEFVAKIIESNQELIDALAIGSTLTDPTRESRSIYDALSKIYAALGNGPSTDSARKLFITKLLSQVHPQDGTNSRHQSNFQNIFGNFIGYLNDGSNLSMTLALGKQDPELNAIVAESFQARARVLTNKVDAHLEFTEELDWLISTYGSTMSGEQLTKAIEEYKQSKGAEWNARFEQERELIASEGQHLMADLAVLDSTGGYEDAVQQLLGHPNNVFAISLHLQKHPDKIDQDTLRVLANTTKYGDGLRKLATEAAHFYIREKVLPKALVLDNPSKKDIEQARAALKEVTRGPLAKILGISPKLQEILGEMIDTMTQPIKGIGRHSVEYINQKKEILKTYDRALSSQGFSPDTLSGGVMRMLGLAASGVSLAWNLENAGKNPGIGFAYGFKAAADAIGISQKMAEFIVKNTDNPGTTTNKLAAKSVDRFASCLNLGMDIIITGSYFKNGAFAKGAASAAGVIGSGAAVISGYGIGGAWLGPAGIAASLLSGVALGAIMESEKTTKFETPESERFLMRAGLSAATSHTLVNQSGDGNSVMPLLAQYAQLKGYDLNDDADQKVFANWLNRMPPEALRNLHLQLCYASDKFDGNVEKLDGNTNKRIETTGGGYLEGIPQGYVNFPPDSVGEIDAYAESFGTTGLPAKTKR